MFFETPNLSFTVTDVMELRQRDIRMPNSRRNFHALSLRLQADTVLSTKTASYHLGDNSISFVPANVDYFRAALVDEMIVIHFQLDHYAASDIQHYTTGHPEVFQPLFEKILACWQEKAPGYRYQCTALLYEIMANCYRENAQPKTAASPIERSAAYLSDHFTEPDVSIGEIAALSYMSEVYFRRLFKEAYGISPARYRTSLRLQKAKNLLASGYYTVKEAAALSGFSDVSYFCRVFREQTGMSPAEYFRNVPAVD